MSHAVSFDPAVVDDAAEALRTQVDLLLDWAADRLMNAPVAGTGAWRAAWESRNSAAGRNRAQAHQIARIAPSLLAMINSHCSDELKPWLSHMKTIADNGYYDIIPAQEAFQV